jgi:hypothetical protein
MGRGPDVAADTRLAGGQERAAGGLLPSSASCAQVPLRMSVETVVHHAVHHRRPATRHGYTGGELCTETDRVSAPSGRQELGSPCRIPGGRRGLERRTPATHHPAPQLQNIAAEKLLKVFAIGSARDYVMAESAGEKRGDRSGTGGDSSSSRSRLRSAASALATAATTQRGSGQLTDVAHTAKARTQCRRFPTVRAFVLLVLVDVVSRPGPWGGPEYWWSS